MKGKFDTQAVFTDGTSGGRSANSKISSPRKVVGCLAIATAGLAMWSIWPSSGGDTIAVSFAAADAPAPEGAVVPRSEVERRISECVADVQTALTPTLVSVSKRFTRN